MSAERKLTHVDDQGQVKMVDVGAKPDSERIATAAGRVLMKPATLELIRQGHIKKGDVLTVARIAGILAAKRTAELIPLCHPIPISGIELDLTIDQAESAVQIVASVKTSGKTGVEMEALTAVATAALTIYDMAKAVDREMRLSDIRLLEKRGGVHGDYIAAE